MKESPRTLARELVLQSLYAFDHGRSEPEEAYGEISREHELDEKNLAFGRNLLQLVISNRRDADQHVARLAENWNLDRIAAIDLNILRMAITELDMVPDTPVKVVLNEAIELAKKFSTIESSKFVNGILDKYVKQREQQV
ncbi:MAG: transcription antitermination factor NusB [Candidatus Zixiibacteriota bacterium]|nr:MAG: transcription antitermination factor NusB [candidate division Zixibacteria bacterium]